MQQKIEHNNNKKLLQTTTTTRIVNSLAIAFDLFLLFLALLFRVFAALLCCHASGSLIRHGVEIIMK